MKIRCALAVVLVSMCVGGRVSAVSLKEERAAFDEKVLRELRGVNPRAADLFAQANQAREKEDHVRARDLYMEVRALVPDSPHPARREAMEELALENRPRALELAREAVALAPSADDLSCLAIVLSSAKEVTDAERQEALDLARRATGQEPDNFYAHAALAQAAVLGDDLGSLDSAATRMTELAPEEAGGYYFLAIAQASHQDFAKAEASLAEARRKGLADAEYQALSQGIHEARPWYSGLGTRAVETVVVWAGGLLLLLGLGALLSRATLRAAARMPAQGIGGTGQAAGSDLALRRVYKGVLWLSCLYYWLSIPIVSLLVLVAGGGLIYGIFALGYVPIKLVVIIVVVVGVTLASIVKSLFVRGRDEDPGLKLAPAEEPRLRDLLHQVAGRIGTRPVDSVYLTPGTELAVMERGGMLKQLRGSSERCLILGVGVLDGLKIGPLKAILAHEYGHFSNKDTAGGGFALGVRRSLYRMMVHLAEGGAAAWYNPAWLFVVGFQRVFLRISHGASRLQEILADRWAAFAYGPEFFEQGLRHVIRRGILFDAHANATLSEVVEAKAALANLYSYQPAKQPDASTVASELETALTREPSPYDSHPSPVDRFRWTRALATTARPAAEDDQESWTLFRDREALERKLTETVRVNLLSQGYEIPAEAAASA